MTKQTPSTLDNYYTYIKKVLVNTDFNVGLFIDGVVFVGCTFNRLHLAKITFTNCKFEECTFNNVHFVNTCFYDCTLTKCNTPATTWIECTIKDTSMIECDFTGTYMLMDVNFVKSIIQGCIFANKDDDPDCVLFGKCKIIQTTFSNYTLEGIRFKKCAFESVKFENVVCSETEFTDCVLLQVLFLNSAFSRMFFDNTTLKHSRFEECAFTNTAKMRSVVFEDTNIFGGICPKDVMANVKICPTTTLPQKTSPALPEQTLKLDRLLVPKTGKFRAFRFATNGVLACQSMNTSVQNVAM